MAQVAITSKLLQSPRPMVRRGKSVHLLVFLTCRDGCLKEACECGFSQKQQWSSQGNDDNTVGHLPCQSFMMDKEA